jgi:hypothetical protein
MSVVFIWDSLFLCFDGIVLTRRTHASCANKTYRFVLYVTLLFPFDSFFIQF